MLFCCMLISSSCLFAVCFSAECLCAVCFSAECFSADCFFVAQPILGANKQFKIKIHKNAYKIDYNHETGTKLKNLLLIDIHIVSSVSARKLMYPSLARLRSIWLDSELFRLGSAREISARAHH
jgi:hypothetical protein